MFRHCHIFNHISDQISKLHSHHHLCVGISIYPVYINVSIQILILVPFTSPLISGISICLQSHRYLYQILILFAIHVTTYVWEFPYVFNHIPIQILKLNLSSLVPFTSPPTVHVCVGISIYLQPHLYTDAVDYNVC